MRSVQELKEAVDNIYEQYRQHHDQDKSISELKAIDREFIPHLHELHGANSSEGFIDLVNVFDTAAHLHVILGSITGNLKHYTDATVLYNYVISIINEKLKSSSTDGAYSHRVEEIYTKLADIKTSVLDIIRTAYTANAFTTPENTYTDTSIGETKPITVAIDKHKDVLTNLREHTKTQLEEIERYRLRGQEAEDGEEKAEWQELYVEDARLLFKHIAKVLKGFLSDLYQEAEAELQQAGIIKPCDYAVMGLGSLALQQATPYSDLEFAILLEHEGESKEEGDRIKEYFRNLTHLVHFKVINLGETIIPTSKYGLALDHLVHKGVNFDLGGKTPLGRIEGDKPYELIKTIEWMMHYVRNEEVDGKKPEHIDKNLPFILENACFIHGNAQLLTDYRATVLEFLQQDYNITESKEEKYIGLKNYQARALKILEEGATELNYMQHQQGATLQTNPYKGDLEKLHPVFDDETEGKLFDVKQEIYRLPDRMVYNLGMYFGIAGDSAWDTVAKLQDRGIIKPEAATNLKNAVTFATLLRLQTYGHNGGQRDNMSTYQIALEHLSEAAKEQFTKQTFYIEGTQLLHKFYYVMLRVMEIAQDLCNVERRKDTEELLIQDNLYADTNYNKGLAHARFSEYQKATEYLEQAQESDPKNLRLLSYLHLLYHKVGKITEAVNFAEEVLVVAKDTYYGDLHNSEIATSYNNLGVAYKSKGEYDRAIENYDQALKMRLEYYNTNPNHPDIAKSYDNLGGAYRAKGEYDHAIDNHTKSVKIMLECYKSNPNHPALAKSYNNLGAAFCDKGEYDNAIENHDKALKIQLECYNTNPNHPDITSSYDGLGTAYRAKGEYDHAIANYNNSLTIQLACHKSNTNHSIAGSYNCLGNAYADKGEYDTAIEYTNKALKIQLEAYASFPNHPTLANSYHNLGAIYEAKGEYDNAIENFDKALKMRLECYKSNPDHPDIAASYHNLGAIYEAKGEYDNAIENFDKALKMRLECYKSNPDHPDIAGSYNNLGNTYSHKGGYDKAIEYYSRALQIYEIAYRTNSNHPDIARSYNNLGNAYREKGEIDKAIEYYSKALEMQKIAHISNPDHPDIAGSYNNLGNAYINKGEIDKALDNYSKVLRIYEITHISDPDHPNIAGSCNNLGNAYSHKGEIDKAIEYYSRALRINEIAYKTNPNHPDIAGSYNNLGNAYREKGEIDKAIGYYSKVLEIQKIAHISNLDHINIARSYNNLGSAYGDKGEIDRSIEYYTKALEIRKTAYFTTPNHPDIADSYNNLGNAYCNKRDVDKAIEFYHKVLEINKPVYSTSHNYYSIAMSYDNLGAIYSQKEEYDRAIENYNKALEMMQIAHKSNTNHPDIAMRYNNIGAVYSSKGEIGKAIEYYNKALKIQKAYSSNQNRSGIAEIYNNLGVVYSKNGEHDKAIKYYEQALIIQCECYKTKPNHLDIAKSYNNLGSACIEKKEYDRAIENHCKALEIRKIVCYTNQNHPDIAASYNSLGDAYRYKGEVDKAVQYYSKALEIRKIVHTQNLNHLDVANSYNNLGTAYGNKGEHDLAIENFNKALKVRLECYKSNSNHPDIAQSYNNLGVAYASKEEYDKAIKYSNKALQIISINKDHPYQWNIQNLLEMLYQYSNKGSVTDSKQIAKLKVNGDVMFYQHKYLEAIINYNKAIDLLTEHAKTTAHKLFIAFCYNKGRAYHEVKNIEQAIQAYTTVLNIDNKHAKSWECLGDCYVRLNNIALASNALTHALSLYNVQDSKSATRIQKKLDVLLGKVQLLGGGTDNGEDITQHQPETNVLDKNDEVNVPLSGES